MSDTTNAPAPSSGRLPPRAQRRPAIQRARRPTAALPSRRQERAPLDERAHAEACPAEEIVRVRFVALTHWTDARKRGHAPANCGENTPPVEWPRSRPPRTLRCGRSAASGLTYQANRRAAPMLTEREAAYRPVRLSARLGVNLHHISKVRIRVYSVAKLENASAAISRQRRS